MVQLSSNMEDEVGEADVVGAELLDPERGEALKADDAASSKGVMPGTLGRGRGVTPATLTGKELSMCLVRLCLTRLAFVLNFFPHFCDEHLNTVMDAYRAT